MKGCDSAQKERQGKGHSGHHREKEELVDEHGCEGKTESEKEPNKWEQ